MPQYLSPGVYVEEVDRGSKPIEGVGTSVAAFVGFTETGSSPAVSKGVNSRASLFDLFWGSWIAGATRIT